MHSSARQGLYPNAAEAGLGIAASQASRQRRSQPRY
jgi:hypothetical protein